MLDQFPAVLARARSGDREALSAIYRALNPGIERYLRGRDPETAEDLAAETWVSVAESIGRFEGDEADFRAWVFTIARNRVIDAHRRARRRPESSPLDAAASDDGPTAAGAAEDAALDGLEAEAALALVRRLPPDQADVIMLRVVAGLDTDRVAKVLGKRPGTIRVLQHRGLRNLERLLGDRRPEPGASA